MGAEVKNTDIDDLCALHVSKSVYFSLFLIQCSEYIPPTFAKHTLCSQQVAVGISLTAHA